MTIRPGFSRTVLILNDVSRKKSSPGTPICPIFGLVSRIFPGFPISAAVCLRISGQKLVQILSVYTQKNCWRRTWGAHDAPPVPQVGPSTARTLRFTTSALVRAGYRIRRPILSLVFMFIFYFVAGRGAKYGDRRVCICLSVSLFVSPLAYLNNHSQNVWKYPVPVTYVRDSVLLWRQYTMLCSFGFVDDVMFSHNGANGPKSKTTRMFLRVLQMAAPGGNVAIYDCRLVCYDDIFTDACLVLLCWI